MYIGALGDWDALLLGGSPIYGGSIEGVKVIQPHSQFTNQTDLKPMGSIASMHDGDLLLDPLVTRRHDTYYSLRCS